MNIAVVTVEQEEECRIGTPRRRGQARLSTSPRLEPTLDKAGKFSAQTVEKNEDRQT